MDTRAQGLRFGGRGYRGGWLFFLSTKGLEHLEVFFFATEAFELGFFNQFSGRGDGTEHGGNGRLFEGGIGRW